MANRPLGGIQYVECLMKCILNQVVRRWQPQRPTRHNDSLIRAMLATHAPWCSSYHQAAEVLRMSPISAYLLFFQSTSKSSSRPLPAPAANWLVQDNWCKLVTAQPMWAHLHLAQLPSFCSLTTVPCIPSIGTVIHVQRSQLVWLTFPSPLYLYMLRQRCAAVIQT